MGVGIGDRNRSEAAAEEGDAETALGGDWAGERGDGEEEVGHWMVVDEGGVL